VISLDLPIVSRWPVTRTIPIASFPANIGDTSPLIQPEYEGCVRWRGEHLRGLRSKAAIALPFVET